MILHIVRTMGGRHTPETICTGPDSWEDSDDPLFMNKHLWLGRWGKQQCCSKDSTNDVELRTEEPGGLQTMGSLRVRHLLSDFTFPFHFHALEKEMATHSSVLAWRIPGTGEPGGLPSMGSHRAGDDWSNLAAAAAYLQKSSLGLGHIYLIIIIMEHLLSSCNVVINT